MNYKISKEYMTIYKWQDIKTDSMKLIGYVIAKNGTEFRAVIDSETEIKGFDNITLEELNKLGIKPSYRVIIAGGREFASYSFLKRKCDPIFDDLDKYYEIIIVSGGARGADKLGEKYAKERGYKIEQFIPNWSLGRHAGMIRNREMGDVSQRLIAFWDENSRGTKNMIEYSQKIGLKVHVFKYMNRKSDDITLFRGEFAYLSNMYECPLVINGLEYNNLESAFQSFKTRDLELRKKFIGLNGVEARNLGRSVELREDWETIKVKLMSTLVYNKFKQNPDLMMKLLSTGDRTIIEGNNHGDTFWGVCDGKGSNKLGFILANVRKILREEQDKLTEQVN